MKSRRVEENDIGVMGGKPVYNFFLFIKVEDPSSLFVLFIRKLIFKILLHRF